MTTRRVLIGALALVASAAWGCVDLGNLASSNDGPTDVCAAGQQKLDGRCVDAPAPQPATDGKCAAGLQDNDKDGLCEASCESAKLGCSRSHCEDASGKASCVCSTGYVREGDGAACVWRGGPRNPGFQNMPAAWEVGGGGKIEATAASTIDPGRARFAGVAACTDGFVHQSFPMPTFAESEPFALTIGGQQSGGYDERSGMSFLVAGGYGGDTSFTATPKLRVCLGDRAYGKTIDLRIRPFLSDPDATSTVDIDRVTINPAPDCPAPGRVMNGDFEGTGGWTASGAGSEVATAVGTSGGRGGRLSTTNLCQSRSLVGLMSAPSDSVPRAALSFSYKGTIDKKMNVDAGPNASLGEVTGTATFQSAHLCIPEWAKGMVHTLRFALFDPGGLCADPNVRDFVFDDVGFVSDSACPAIANVMDGGFEHSNEIVSAWLLEHDTEYSTGAEIVRADASSTAHSGTGYVSLYSGQVCHYGRAKQTITVPQSAGTAGPAVKLWYRLPTKVKGLFSTSPGGELAVSATWKQQIVCLDPKQAGRPLPFEITASGGYGTCATSFSSERIDIDDVDVTTDASCPAK